jgi:ADP-ribose pyrophosphatase YjhB (NUDIX family)
MDTFELGEFMRILKKSVHIEDIENKNVFERTAARGIVLKGEEMLLIFTKRYNDYSIPGGGVDQGESVEKGLLRELAEETGAQRVKITKPYGIYEEYRETYHEGYDMMHMTSYFYVCDADKELGDASPESYEINNGSVPVWVNIREAIAYNKKVIKENANSMGLSIKRETFMLEHILDELIK